MPPIKPPHLLLIGHEFKGCCVDASKKQSKCLVEY